MRLMKLIALGAAATFILGSGIISASAAGRPTSTHGSAVSAIAKVKTNVAAHTTGALKVNHGGAVRKAAHTKP